MYRSHTPESHRRSYSDYHSGSQSRAEPSRPTSQHGCLRSSGSSPERPSTHKSSHCTNDRQYECKTMYKGRYFHSTPSSCCGQGHSRSRSDSGSAGSKKRERAGSAAKAASISSSIIQPLASATNTTAQPPPKSYVHAIPKISKFSRHNQSTAAAANLKNSKLQAVRREPFGESNNNSGGAGGNTHQIQYLNCSMEGSLFEVEVDGHGIRIPSLPSVAISSNWRATGQPGRLRSDRRDGNSDGDRTTLRASSDVGKEQRERRREDGGQQQQQPQVQRERSSSLSGLLN